MTSDLVAMVPPAPWYTLQQIMLGVEKGTSPLCSDLPVIIAARITLRKRLGPVGVGQLHTEHSFFGDGDV